MSTDNRHNYFSIECTDAKGNTTQKAIAYNLTTLIGRRTLLTNQLPLYIVLGGGTGEPTNNDTRLFQPIVSKSSTYSSRVIDHATLEVTLKTTLLPTEHVGAAFTEIGVSPHSGINNNISTHAMLTDSLGNQVSIVKTDTENMHITAVYYVNFISSTNKPDSATAEYAKKYNGFHGARSLFIFDRLYNLDIPIHPRKIVSNTSISLDPVPSTGGVYKYKLNTDITAENTYFAGVGAHESIGYANAFRLQDIPDIRNNPISNALVGNGDGTTRSFNILNNGKNIEIFKNGVVTTDYVIRDKYNASTKTDFKIFKLGEFTIFMYFDGLVDDNTGYKKYLSGVCYCLNGATKEIQRIPVVSDNIVIDTWGTLEVCNGILFHRQGIFVFDLETLQTNGILTGKAGVYADTTISSYLTYINGVLGVHPGNPTKFLTSAYGVYEIRYEQGVPTVHMLVSYGSKYGLGAGIDAQGNAYQVAGLYHTGNSYKLNSDWSATLPEVLGSSRYRHSTAIKTPNFYLEFNIVDKYIQLNKLDVNGNNITELRVEIPPSLRTIDYGNVSFVENNNYICLQTYLDYDYRKIFMFDKASWSLMYIAQVGTGGADKMFWSMVDDTSPLLSGNVMPVERGHEIIFNEPPALGVSITCSYSLTRLSKNANNVLDIEAQVYC